MPGDRVLELARGTLLRGGAPVHLRPQACDLLTYFAQNWGRWDRVRADPRFDALVRRVGLKGDARKLLTMSPDTQPHAPDRTRRPFVLEEAVAILARTPATLDALLRGLPEPWVTANEGGDSWSPYDVVGHLIHGERADWIPRARVILEHGETRAFEPFDRLAQVEESRGKSLAQLLDEFAAQRAESLRALEALALTGSDLDRRGRHPDFGSVTLRQLLSTWVAHDLDHVMQVARVLGRQFTDEVGPWKAYLRVARDT